MDKIPFIARLIQSYMGPRMEDQERVQVFLELKHLMNKDNLQLPNAMKFGSQCIFFLASFNAIQDYSFHSNDSKVTLFHLNHCLTIINAYHLSADRRALLAQSCKKPTSPTDGQTVVLTTLDLPGLELSAALHVLINIIKCQVSLQHPIMNNVLKTSLETLYTVIIGSQCPPHLQKSYLALIITLIERNEKGDMQLECIQILARIFTLYRSDALRTGNFD